MRDIKKILPTVRQAIYLFVHSVSARNLDCHEDRDLSCSCAISSRALVTILKDMGYDAKIVYGYLSECSLKELNKKEYTIYDVNHAWVEIGDYIIDLTASQFNYKRKLFPEIVFSKDKRRWIKLGEASHRSLKPFSEWPHQQIPRKKYINLIVKNFEDLSRSN